MLRFLRLRRIEPAEVFEHEPPLLWREPRQLFPRRIAQSRARARRPGLEHGGKVHAVTRAGATGALAVLVGLAAGQRSAGVEQAAGQALLPLDRLPVESPRFELGRPVPGPPPQ